MTQLNVVGLPCTYKFKAPPSTGNEQPTSTSHGLQYTNSTFVTVVAGVCRYYAICRPLQARYLHTARRAACLVVVFWVTSLVLLLPQLFIQRLDPLLEVKVHRGPDWPPTAEVRLVHVCVEFFVDWRWNVVYTFVFYVAICVLPVHTTNHTEPLHLNIAMMPHSRRNIFTRLYDLSIITDRGDRV